MFPRLWVQEWQSQGLSLDRLTLEPVLRTAAHTCTCVQHVHTCRHIQDEGVKAKELKSRHTPSMQRNLPDRTGNASCGLEAKALLDVEFARCDFLVWAVRPRPRASPRAIVRIRQHLCVCLERAWDPGSQDCLFLFSLPVFCTDEQK